MSEHTESAAIAHDKWFREQVGQALKQADDPNTKWVSDEQAQAIFAKKRAEIAKRIEAIPA